VSEDESQKPRSLTEKTVSGATWTGASSALTQAISLLGTLVLARLLTPEDYGLVGMARLAIGLIAIFRELGTTAAIIQRKQLSQEFLSSIFWANLALAVVTFGLAIATSPLVALFFHQSKIGPIVRLLAAGFIISALSSVPSALLNREMAFRKVMMIEIGAASFATCLAVGMALRGAGVWSLVISSLAGTCITTVFLWWSCPWRPKWLLDWMELRSIASFSLNLSGFNLVNYFSRNADNAIVGRYLGAYQLGFYQVAYNLMLYAVQNISQVMGRVLFPVFAKVQDDNVRLRQAYTKAVSTIAVVTFPMMAGVMAVAEPFVRAVLGEKWHPVASLLIILAPVGLMQSVVTTVGNIYYAKGRADWLFRWGLIATTVSVGSFLVGLPWGIRGVAVAYLIVNLLLVYPAFALPFRLIDLKMNDFLRPLWPILGFSMTMLAAVRILGFLLRFEKPGEQLATLVPVGVLVYCSLLFLVRPVAVVNLLSIRQRSAN
jgi:O-antigen/teichoic acid export membrane protein